jgi:hypothetical protein
MPKYNVEVVANINTVWETDTSAEALALADEWVREEYGDLIHKANLVIREIK